MEPHLNNILTHDQVPCHLPIRTPLLIMTCFWGLSVSALKGITLYMYTHTVYSDGDISSGLHLGKGPLKDTQKVICMQGNSEPPPPSSGGVTPIDSIVTAVTTLVNPYTKEGVESLRLLPYTSVNVRVVKGQWLKFNAVNSQSPKISVVNGLNAEKS